MARVDSITVFMCVVIFVYTTLAGGVVSTYAKTDYSPNINTLNINEFGVDFEFYEYYNISKPILSVTDVYYTTLIPERRVTWWNPVVGEGWFTVSCKGIGFPANLLWNRLEPLKFYESDIISNYNENLNYTYEIFNKKGQLETHVIFSTQFFYNSTTDEIFYLYDDIQDSINNGELTVLVGTNATYIDNYDIGRIFGMLVGFGIVYDDIPNEINVLISGIWWIIIILLGIKLVLG